MLHIKETGKGISFAVRVIPRASRREVAGVRGDTLKIKLTAPPVEGKANEACVDLIADFLRVPKSSVTIIAGSKTKNKRLFVAGIGRELLESRLRQL